MASGSKAPTVRESVPRGQEEPKRRTKRAKERPTKATTTRWRRLARPRLLQTLVSRTESLRWSTALIRALLEELYIDADIEKLLGTPLRKLPQQKYPQAIAVALILRHSWRADDFADILRRLGLAHDRA